MLNFMKRLAASTRGAMDITTIVVDVALIVALIPIIKTFIANANNLTASETALLSLVGLFIVIALIVSIVRQTGLSKKKM